VLEYDGEIIGYALMMIVLDEAHLLNLSIAKAYQKQGLGRLLLEHMIQIARQYKAANMFLEVRPSNISAIALYENIVLMKWRYGVGIIPRIMGVRMPF